MCGISGCWSYRNYQLDGQIFENFSQEIKHRGPDCTEIKSYEKNRIRLGFHRLSIIDLTGASMQPMEHSDTGCVIVFNGEIFNFQEVRKELLALGHVFKSNGDAEVILNGYIEWDEEIVFKLNGMWAFAIWDPRKELFFVSRDRFGVKPVYYSSFDGRFYFSSELKSFPKLRTFSATLNSDYLNGAIAPQSLPSTLLRNVYKLPPGHNLIINSGGFTRMYKWWKTSSHIDNDVDKMDEDSVFHLFSDLLRDSCTLRTRTDTKYSISLSGGLDSSVVTAFTLDKNGDIPSSTKLFTQSFPNSDEDESGYANEVATRFNQSLTDTSVGKFFDQETIIESIYSLEDSSIFPLGMWNHYRSISQNSIPVVLEGHGGDELFCGYPFLIQNYAQRKLSQLRFSEWWQLSAIDRKVRSGNIQMDDNQSVVGLFLRDLTQLKEQSRSFVRRQLGGLFKLNSANLSDETLQFVRARDLAFYQESRNLDALNRLLYYQFHFGSLPSILMNVDKLSMAHGVEVRSPLLDWRIVTLSFSLPEKFKLRDGFSKYLLRRISNELLPANITERTGKKGFAPSLTWFADGLADFGEVIINDPSFVLYKEYELSDFRSLYSKAVERKDWKTVMSLWGDVQLFLLMRKFLN